MKLPMFWRDTGTWNDAVVSASIAVSLMVWCVLGWWLESPGLLLAAVFLGPVAGFGLGLGAVAVLCRFFNERKP